MLKLYRSSDSFSGGRRWTTWQQTAVRFSRQLPYLRYFNDLPDPRQAVKVVYPLDEVLLLSRLAVLAGAETVTGIARFGAKKVALLRRFRPFLDGTPPHDRMRRYLRRPRRRTLPALLRRLGGFGDWHLGWGDRDRWQDRAPTRPQEGNKAPIHMVSAFAARQRLVLGQVKVAEKSNEIIAIPQLLNVLAIEGAIVTIDAMGKAGQRFRQA